MEKQTSEYILEKDNQFIAFNKPCGLLVQSGRKEKTSLHQLAEIYCKHPLGLVHRLDRPASGVCIFAKTKKALAHFNKQFQEQKAKKTYWAVVPKGELPEEGRLTHYIRRNGRKLRAEYASEERPGFKRAELSYRKIAESDRYQLLEVELHTGRFHQIRAQLAAVGFPIKGDVKYGAKRSNKDRSIHLHARSLELKHPTSGETISLSAEPPQGPIWEAFLQQLENC